MNQLSMFYRTNYKRGRMLIWAYNLHRLYKREDNRDYLIMQQRVKKLVSNPQARMVKLVDTTDLKSVGCNGRAGSSPAPSTTLNHDPRRDDFAPFGAFEGEVK